MEDITEHKEGTFVIKPMDCRRFQVDWDRVKTVDDVKRLIKALKPNFYGTETIAGIEDLVVEVK